MKRKADLLERLAGYVCAYNGCFMDIVDIFYNLESMIESNEMEKVEVARAMFFGDVRNWNDDIFYIADDGNFYSCSEREHEKNIMEQEKDIINEFLEIYYYSNSECLETEHLEILSELKALGCELPEGLDV